MRPEPPFSLGESQTLVSPSIQRCVPSRVGSVWGLPTSCTAPKPREPEKQMTEELHVTRAPQSGCSWRVLMLPLPSLPGGEEIMVARSSCGSLPTM